MHLSALVADAFGRLDTLITAAYGPAYMLTWFNYLSDPTAFGRWQIDFNAAILDSSDQVHSFTLKDFTTWISNRRWHAAPLAAWCNCALSAGLRRSHRWSVFRLLDIAMTYAASGVSQHTRD